MTTSAWTEVGDRCWVRRYPEWDVNVGVVAGTDGLLVIDTRASLDQGQALRQDLRGLAAGPVRWVVNTHWHFDHTYGNEAFLPDVGDSFYAHENAARDVRSTPALVPERTFSAEQVLDLGDRAVRLSHLGRGHTDGDIVIRCDDVVFAGDLVEQSGDPSFGDDCFPIEWPNTLLAVATLLDDSTVVVPGHGDPVDRRFVISQLRDLTEVADTISQLHASHRPVEEALAHEQWPYPAINLADAIRRGYEQLEGQPRRIRVGRYARDH